MTCNTKATSEYQQDSTVAILVELPSMAGKGLSTKTIHFHVLDAYKNTSVKLFKH
jgi:hypothetical protein